MPESDELYLERVDSILARDLAGEDVFPELETLPPPWRERVASALEGSRRWRGRPRREPVPERELTRFLRRALHDLARGRLRSLARYQRRFPRIARDVAREYRALPTAAPPATSDAQRLGPYRLERVLGRGGQGTVHLATDERLGRRVALKVLGGAGFADQARRERFRREAETASRLDHPGLCPVYDVGTAGDRWYIAMPFVAGRRLRDLLDDERAQGGPPRARREIERRLSLLESVARAAHAAHEAGVVHRDLKPENVMVTPEGAPVVLDFGLARAAEAQPFTLTALGSTFGTPSYMAPEQIDGRRAADRRADVWALGAMLYETLTLERPFEEPTRERLFRAILTQAPADPRRKNPSLPRDAGRILRAALEKDADHRYATAAALADDLARCRRREPLQVHPVHRLRRAARWARRNRALAASIAGLFAVLAAGLVASGVLLRQKERTLRRGEGSRLTAQAQVLARRNPGLALPLALEGAERRPGAVASQTVLNILESHREVGLVAHGGPVRAVAISPDATRFATAGDDGRVVLWDATGAREIRSWETGGDPLSAVAFDGSGTEVAAAGKSGALHRWRVADGTALPKLGHGSAVYALAFGDGRFASGGESGTLVLHAGAGRDEIRVAGEFAVRSVARAPFGWAIGDAHGVVRTIDGEGRLRATLETSHDVVAGIDVSADGSMLLAASLDNTAWLFDLRSGERLARLTGHASGVFAARFDATGTRALTTSWDRTLIWWDLESHTPLQVLTGHAGPVVDGRVGADGRVVTASEDGTARVWDLSPKRDIATADRFLGPGATVSFAPTGPLVLSTHWNGAAALWDSRSGRLHRELQLRGARLTGGAFSADGAFVALAEVGGVVTLFEAETGRQVRRLAVAGAVAESGTSVRFAKRGHRFLVACAGGAAELQDARDEAVRLPLRAMNGFFVVGPMFRAAFDRSGTRLVTVAGPGKVCLWDARTGACVRTFDTATDVVRAVAIDGDAQRVATGSESGTVRIFDAGGGEPPRVVGHPATVTVVRFDAAGDRLVTGGMDGIVRIFDARTGALRRALPGHESLLYEVCFSPDERWLATASFDRTARLFDVERGALALVQEGHTDGVTSVAFRRDGRLVASADVDGGIRFWPVDPVALARRLPHRRLTAAERAEYEVR